MVLSYRWLLPVLLEAMNEERLILDCQVDVSHFGHKMKGNDRSSTTKCVFLGIAKRLRKVGEAAPVVAAVVTGTEKEQIVSSRYGGFGDNPTSMVHNPI